LKTLLRYFTLWTFIKPYSCISFTSLKQSASSSILFFFPSYFYNAFVFSILVIKPWTIVIYMFVFYNCFKFVWTWHRDLCWPVQKLRSLRAFALLGLMATSTCHHFSGCEKTTQLFFVETRLMWRKKLSLLSLWLMRKIMECIVWSHGRPLPETRLYSHFSGGTT